MSAQKMIFHVQTYIYVLIGVLCSLLVSVGLLAEAYGLILIAIIPTLVVFFILHNASLEVGQTCLRWRSIFGTKTIQYSEVTGAGISVVDAMHYSLTGAAVFWLQLRHSSKTNINLRVYSVGAAAAIFTMLEARGIDIDVEDRWAATSMGTQIRSAQTKP